jgi:hypothetical protein
MYFQILLIIIIILVLSNSNNIENYDAKIPNTNKKDCGIKCTNTFNCLGFAHKKDGSCYLSHKSTILNKPIDSVYSDDYSVDDYRCNKLQPIYRPADITVPEIMKRNALYNCSENETGEYVLNLFSNQKSEPVYDFDDIEDMNVVPYELEYYNWPIVRDHNLDKNNTKQTNYLVYQKSDDEYLGDYLYPNRCVDNIPEKACLNICSNDPKCVGIEWNPYYLRDSGDNTYNVYENICCPRKTIETVIPRRNAFINGRFYLKSYLDDLNKNSTYITNN